MAIPRLRRTQPPFPDSTHQILDPVATCPGDDRSLLFLAGVSAAMRLITAACFLLFPDFLLRQQPVIQGPLSDPSLVQFVGSPGNRLVGYFRHRYPTGWFSTAPGSSAGVFRFLLGHEGKRPGFCRPPFPSPDIGMEPVGRRML